MTIKQRTALGEAIRQARLAAGLTQIGLAAKLKIHQGQLSGYETGYSEPKLSTLARIAAALGVKVESFLR